METQTAPRKFGLTDKRIHPGWFISIEGAGEFQILEPDPALNTRLLIPVEDITSHEKQIISVGDLDNLAAQNTRVFIAPTLEELNELRTTQAPEVSSAPTSAINPQLVASAEKELSMVKFLDELLEDEERRCCAAGVPFNKNQALLRICSELQSTGQRNYKGYSRSNYYRYRKMIKQADWDVATLAADHHRNSFGGTKMSRAQIHMVDEIILTHGSSRGFVKGLPAIYDLLQGYYEHTRGWWLDPEKCTDIPMDLVKELMDAKLPIDLIFSNPEKATLLSKIKLPSRAWFYRHFHWFTRNPGQSEKEMIEKYGRAFYEEHLMVFDSYVRRASLPLEYVFADHCYIDIFVTDEETRQQVFRVWLTLLIDAFSRGILGMALLANDPSIESIQSALENSIWDKTDFLAGLGLEYPDGKGWECHGISNSLSLDNAWAHHSLSLEALCRRISFNGHYNSIELDFRPPYRGRYGALIERYFGNIQPKLNVSLKIGTIRNIKPDSVRNAAKEATFLMKDIKRAIAQLIVIYMHTPHRELNDMTPHQKWLEGMQSGWPKVPPRTPANERIFWRSSPDTRVITAKGVSIFGLTYWGPELKIAQRVDKDGKPVHYSYSYDPSDISRIALFREDKYVCDLYAKQLRNADGSHLHPGLADRQLARKLAVKSGEAALQWLKFVQEAQELGSKRQAEQKAMQKSEKRKAKQQKPPTTSMTTADGLSQLDRLKNFSGE